MLRKAFRLKSRWDFKKTLASQRLGANDCVAVYALPANPNRPGDSQKQPGPKFGLIVSKKIHKRAVVRNRIKRRLREIIRTRLLAPENARFIAPYGPVVIIARSGAVEAEYETLAVKLMGCFNPALRGGQRKNQPQKNPNR